LEIPCWMLGVQMSSFFLSLIGMGVPPPAFHEPPGSDFISVSNSHRDIRNVQVGDHSEALHREI
jgi:hypothetical protein